MLKSDVKSSPIVSSHQPFIGHMLPGMQGTVRRSPRFRSCTNRLVTAIIGGFLVTSCGGGKEAIEAMCGLELSTITVGLQSDRVVVAVEGEPVGDLGLRDVIERGGFIGVDTPDESTLVLFAPDSLPSATVQDGDDTQVAAPSRCEIPGVNVFTNPLGEKPVLVALASDDGTVSYGNPEPIVPIGVGLFVRLSPAS